MPRVALFVLLAACGGSVRETECTAFTKTQNAGLPALQAARTEVLGAGEDHGARARGMRAMAETYRKLNADIRMHTFTDADLAPKIDAWRGMIETMAAAMDRMADAVGVGRIDDALAVQGEIEALATKEAALVDEINRVCGR